TTHREVAGGHYHPPEKSQDGTPGERAHAFCRAAGQCLRDFPPFDLGHLHDWMTGLLGSRGPPPTPLSLSSVEATRRNGTPPSTLSLEIQEAERAVAWAADCVLTPDWLRDQAIAELGLDGPRVRAFPMEGRVPNEWEAPLDYGQVKGEI